MKHSITLTCNLSYHDFMGVADMSKREAARRLGISEWTMGRITRQYGMSHWYTRSYAKSRCISKGQAVELGDQGYCQKDAAHILGISYDYMRLLVREWKIRDHFPGRSRAAQIGRMGYAG